MPEKFENDVFTLKKDASNVFRAYYAGKLENAAITGHFVFVFEENWGREITLLS